MLGQDVDPQRWEASGEIFYGWQATRALLLRPNLQYIHRVGATSRYPDAVVAGSVNGTRAVSLAPPLRALPTVSRPPSMSTTTDANAKPTGTIRHEGGGGGGGGQEQEQEQEQEPEQEQPQQEKTNRQTNKQTNKTNQQAKQAIVVLDLKSEALLSV